MITRRSALGLVTAAAASAWFGRSPAHAAPLTYTLKPKEIAKGAWLIEGAQEAITQANGGAIANVAILDSKAGAIVIDTGPSRRYGEALSSLASELTGKPVARAYLTHFHPDHVFGSQAFAPGSVTSTPAVAQGLKDYGEAFADSMYRAAGDWMRGTQVVVPDPIAEGGVEDFGDRRIRFLAMRGHTDSDLVLFEERSGLMFTGDLVFLDRAPTTPHADIERWRISLANLGAIPCSAIVPGHGPCEEKSDRGIRQTREWIEAVENMIKDAFDRGLDISEAVALPLPAWMERIALARYEFERSVMHLYPKLESERWPRIDGAQ